MNAEIISIGTELLLGEITDTNATYIARNLRDYGINLFYVTQVGDNLERITRILETGLQRSDLIITTGGLGPTVDDMTRQGVAAATGRELVFQQHLLDQIAQRFAGFGVQMTENNRQQAMIPAGAIILENPVGTAPCYIVESERGIIISLPGVPREMKYIMQNSVLPYLRDKMGLPAIIKARVLHTTGIGESTIDSMIGEFMTMTNPTVGLAAHSGQTDIRITARADSEAEADSMIAGVENAIRDIVGKYIYAVDRQQSLDEVVLSLLREQNEKIAIVEAGTKGVIAARLQSNILATDLIAGSHSFTSLEALHSHLQPPSDDPKAVAEMAVNWILQQTGSRLGMAILHDQGKTSLAVSTPERIWSRHMTMGDDQGMANWAGNWELGYIWRYLTGAHHDTPR